jgi:hypothetical protein
MSTDLSRPLVPAMGLHDVVDGLITFREVQQAMTTMSVASELHAIAIAIKSLIGLCQRKNWATDDPLGIGGLLFDAWRLCQLFDRNSQADVDLLEALLDGCNYGLTSFVSAGNLARTISNRLAFRELGLSIGLKAVSAIAHRITNRGSYFEIRGNLRRSINLLQQQDSIGDEIIGEWLPHAVNQNKSWRAHQDINEVMLATALIPNTFLSIGRAISHENI